MSSCNWAARNSWRATATASPATSWYVIRRPAPIAIPRPSPVWPSASNFPSRARSLLTASPVARRPSFGADAARVSHHSHRRRLVRRRGPGHGRRLFRHAACRGGWGAVQQVRAQPGTAPTAERSQQVFSRAQAPEH